MVIFNEKAYAEKLLQDGYIRKNKKLKDIFILAKLFKYKGLSQLKACKETLKFIEKFDDTIYTELKTGLKKRAINTVKNAYNNNYTLRHNTIIEISKAELVSIAKLETTGKKQIMFIFMIMSKFFNNGTGTFYVTYADVFRYTNLDYQTNNITNIINSLIENGYLEVINKHKIRNIVNTYSASLYERNYFQVHLECGDDVVYTVDSFDNLMEDFAKSMKKVGQYYCEVCSKVVTNKNRKKRYCDGCVQTQRRNSWNKSKIKYRGNI